MTYTLYILAMVASLPFLGFGHFRFRWPRAGPADIQPNRARSCQIAAKTFFPGLGCSPESSAEIPHLQCHQPNSVRSTNSCPSRLHAKKGPPHVSLHHGTRNTKTRIPTNLSPVKPN